MIKQELINQARKKLNYTFPSQLRVFYYKGLMITKSMFFGKEYNDE